MTNRLTTFLSTSRRFDLSFLFEARCPENHRFNIDEALLNIELGIASKQAFKQEKNADSVADSKKGQTCFADGFEMDIDARWI